MDLREKKTPGDPAALLVAISASGGSVSAFQIMPCLYYPYLLAAASVIHILIGAGKEK